MILASDLHVISVLSNPVRFKKRASLFADMMVRLKDSPATHWFVEAVFGEREAEVLLGDHPRHIIVRCDDEIWLKENLINVAVRHLPKDAKYVMWLDGDVKFEREDWAIETVHALQHYDAVQPFDTVLDLGPNGETLETHRGFAYCHTMGAQLCPQNKLGGWTYGGPYWHPGYAFAFTMDAWNAVGGMIDRSICGAGDYHMACALIGQGGFSYPGNAHPNYKHMVDSWQSQAEHSIRQNIGYVSGTLLHYFHGHKADRKYIERWDIITKNDFDPYSDVFHDRHGVLRLPPAINARQRNIRDQMRVYFRQRNEDA